MLSDRDLLLFIVGNITDRRKIYIRWLKMDSIVVHTFTYPNLGEAFVNGLNVISGIAYNTFAPEWAISALATELSHLLIAELRENE